MNSIHMSNIGTIEKAILDILGCHTVITEIANIKCCTILDRNNEVVGFAEYDESTCIYHLRINAPAFWLDTERHKDSKKIKCKYKFGYITNGFEYEGKAKIYIK